MKNYIRKTLGILALTAGLTGCTSLRKASEPQCIGDHCAVPASYTVPPAPAERKSFTDNLKPAMVQGPKLGLARITAAYDTKGIGTESNLVVLNDLPLGITAELYGERVGTDGFDDPKPAFISGSLLKKFETPIGKIGPIVNYSEDVGVEGSGTTSFGMTYKAPVDFLLEGRFFVRDNHARDRFQLIFNKDISELLGEEKGSMYVESISRYDFADSEHKDGNWKVDGFLAHRLVGPLEIIAGATFSQLDEPVYRIGLQLAFPVK